MCGPRAVMIMIVYTKDETKYHLQKEKKNIMCTLCVPHVYKKEEKHVIQFNHYHVCYPLNAILDSVKEGVCASQDDVFMVDG